jgi:ATP-dependent RNA helicase RhlB
VHLPVSTGAIYGGVPYEKQERLLRQGTELLVGTPGRLLDFVKRKQLLLGETDLAVIDEADRLFDMGFYYEIWKILKGMPRPGQRQTMLFSATLDRKVRQLAAEFMTSPVEVAIEPQRMTVSAVEQVLYHVGSHEKVPLLLGLLRTRAPRAVLIFTNTKVAVEDLAKRLSHNGYECFALSGDLPQRKRERTIEAIKQGRITRIVATDVAARGLHIEDLDLVVNFDVPEDPENYVHRIGRTARAGRTGAAVTLACERYVEALEAIERLIGMRLPVGVVDDSLLDEDRTAGRNVRRMHLPSLPSVAPHPQQHQQHASDQPHPKKKRRRRRKNRHSADSSQTPTPAPHSPATAQHPHEQTHRSHSFFRRIVRAFTTGR